MPDRAPEPDLHLVAQHEVDHIFGVAGPDRKLDPWMGGDELLQEPGQDVGADSGGGPDHQVAGRGRFDLLQDVASIDQGPQRALGVGHPRPPRVRQAHPV
jgi:hypothetical protein